jgi:hypothetical protein
MCVFEELVLEKGIKQLSGSLLRAIKFSFIFFSIVISNLSKLGFNFALLQYINLSTYPEMKFSRTGISFYNISEVSFRSREHGSALAFISLKCTVNLN